MPEGGKIPSYSSLSLAPLGLFHRHSADASVVTGRQVRRVGHLARRLAATQDPQNTIRDREIARSAKARGIPLPFGRIPLYPITADPVHRHPESRQGCFT